MIYHKKVKSSGELVVEDNLLSEANNITISIETASTGNVVISTRAVEGSEWHGSHKIELSGDRTLVLPGVYFGIRLQPSFDGQYTTIISA